MHLIDETGAQAVVDEADGALRQLGERCARSVTADDLGTRPGFLAVGHAHRYPRAVRGSLDLRGGALEDARLMLFDKAVACALNDRVGELQREPLVGDGAKVGLGVGSALGKRCEVGRILVVLD